MIGAGLQSSDGGSEDQRWVGTGELPERGERGAGAAALVWLVASWEDEERAPHIKTNATFAAHD